MGKYEEERSAENLSRAEDALKLALDINAELPLAHSMYAQLDVDVGRADAALLRLVDRAKTRGADPEIFAGLVYVCRFCGLLSASLAANEQARRLDATIRTSVVQTYWMRGEYERVAAIGMTSAPYVGALALAALGRADEAIAALTHIEQAGARIPRAFIIAARTLLEGKNEESAEAARRFAGATKDPEGLYYAARHLAHLGDTETALHFLARGIEGGFFAYPVLARDAWLKPLEHDSRFVELLRRAEARHRAAAAGFVARGGDQALGLTGEP